MMFIVLKTNIKRFKVNPKMNRTPVDRVKNMSDVLWSHFLKTKQQIQANTHVLT